MRYRWGYIDKSGNEVTPLMYNSSDEFREGFAMVRLIHKFGFIDKTGEEVIPVIYDGAMFFSEGLAPVKLNDKWGCVDTTGNVAIPFKYDFGDILFSGGIAPVRLNGKYGYIDKTGAVVVPIEYTTWQEASKQKMRYRLFSNYAKNYADSKIAEENFIADAHRVININLSLNQYNANSQTFMVTDDFFGKNIPLHVPASRAKNFSDSWEQIEFSIQYGIENDRITIKKINFKLPNGETYNTAYF